MTLLSTYNVFHQFRQAKFAYGGSILSLKQFFAIAPAVLKNGARYISSQNWLKNNHISTIIFIRETNCTIIFCDDLNFKYKV